MLLLVQLLHLFFGIFWDKKMTLEEFKKSNKVKNSSSLLKFKDEILELYGDNFPQKAIVEFLKTNGIQTSQQNVSKFLNKHNKSKSKIEVRIDASEKTVKKEIKESKNSNIFGMDLDKKIGKNTEIQKVDWA